MSTAGAKTRRQAAKPPRPGAEAQASIRAIRKLADARADQILAAVSAMSGRELRQVAALLLVERSRGVRDARH
jgi:hypothetical protein